jgi:transposase
MTRFPTAGQLVSWAKFAPGVKESAATQGSGSTGHGNPYLARVLGEAAVAAGKTDTFLGERYRRIACRRGAKRASWRSAAPSWSSSGTCWPTRLYGSRTWAPACYDTRINAERARRNHLRQLEALGYKVTLQPAA